MIRYYIFAGNKYRIKESAEKAIYESDNIDDAYYRFLEYSMEDKYPNIYLIADFGKDDPYKSITGYSKINITQEYFPFIIIAEKLDSKTKDAEYNNNHTEGYIRKDCITVNSDGFSEKFLNNRKSFERFEYYVNNDIHAYLSLKRGRFSKINSIYVVDTREINRNSSIKNRKYKIEYIPVSVRK